MFQFSTTCREQGLAGICLYWVEIVHSLAPPTLYLPLIGGGGRKGSGISSTNELCRRCQEGGPIRLSQ